MHTHVEYLSIVRTLELAAIHDENRNHLLYQALRAFAKQESITNTAFILIHQEQIEKQTIISTGNQEADIHRWLTKQTMLPFPDLLHNLQKNKSPLSDYKISLFPIANTDQQYGIWIIWSHQSYSIDQLDIKLIHTHLEAISLIHETNTLLGKPEILNNEIIEAIRHKDPGGILAALSLTRTIGEADLVYWGDIENERIQITSHLGTNHAGFGFELPVGTGFGGKAALGRDVLAVTDYQNSQYRNPKVSPMIDREELRSGLVFPIRSKQIQTSGLIYIARREIKPFSIVQRLSLHRLVHKIEPLHKEENKNSAFFIQTGLNHFISQKKDELRVLLQQAKHISEIEAWISTVIKGHAIVIDQNGVAYSSIIQTDFIKENAKYISLDNVNGSRYGKLLLIPSINLSQTDWPEFIDDIKAASRIVLERQLKPHVDLSLRRSEWIHTLLNEETNETIYYNGLRLGLPLDQGQFWMITWDKLDKSISSNLQMRFEHIALKQTKGILTFLDNSAVLMIDAKQAHIDPSKLRDQLLKVIQVQIWVIHGSSYTTFNELKEKMEHAIDITNEARKTNQEPYVLEVSHFGIDGFLKKSSIRDALNTLTHKMLYPIMEYDVKNNTTFTKTLAYSVILKSPDRVASHLFIHKNTVLYRIKRAEEILDIDTELPKNRIALELTAYNWIKQEEPEFLSEMNRAN